MKSVDSNIKNLNSYLESTNLQPTILGKDVDSLVSEAIEYNIYGVCVPPFWVKRASREIGENDLQLVTVIGYPLGYQMTETKLEEARLAIRDGADELDLVLNLSSFSNRLPWTKIELAKFSKYLHEEGKLLKVIVETDLWNEEQLQQLCRMVADSGADFFKTSTGYHRNPVNPELITKLRSWLPSSVGIKASGGIRNRQQAIDLINSGADRLGTSNAISILEET